MQLKRLPPSVVMRYKPFNLASSGLPISDCINQELLKMTHWFVCVKKVGIITRWSVVLGQASHSVSGQKR